MATRSTFAAIAIALLFASSAPAQDFGVLESAETLNPGNFKIGVYPLFVLPDPGDTEFRLGVSVGYGFTNSFDLEGRAAFSGDVILLGGDGEYWFLKRRPLDMSLRGGLHVGLVEGEIGDTIGADVSLLGSAHLGTRLEVIGALDMAFNSTDVGSTRDRFTTVHLVPGIEVALSRDVDFVAEFGLGVTNRSSHYAGFGLAFYIR